MVSNIVSSVGTIVTSATVSNPVPIPSPAKGLNALLGLPTPSVEPQIPGTHPSVSNLDRNVTESDKTAKEPGAEEAELAEKDTGVDKDEEGNVVETMEVEATDAGNGTEEIEIAEVVDEESGQNEVMIITEAKADNQVN